MSEPPSPATPVCAGWDAGSQAIARKSEATTEPMQRHEGARELNDYLQTPLNSLGF